MNTRMLSLVTVHLAVGLFTSTAPLGAQTCAPPPTGLVGWWSGDGHYFDLVGTNHGVPLGEAGLAAGKVGQCFSLNADGAAVTIAHNPMLDVPLTGFTAEFWMQGVKNQPQSIYLVVDKSHGWADSTGWLFQGYSDSGRIFFGIGAGGPGINNFPLATSTTDVLDGQWHHVAGTWDGAALLIFVDGAQQDQAALAIPFNNTRPVNLGYSWGGGLPNRFFRGKVDELGIYNRALTPGEIAALYAAGSAGKCKPPFPAPAGLVSWWPGENNAKDIVGPNHATPAGSVGYAPGLVGTAFQLSGGFFEAPCSPSLYCNWGETTMSVEGWIFPSNINLPFHVCGMRDDTYGRSSWQIAYDWTWPPPPVGVWTHVALTVGVSATPGLATLRYYENGVVKQATDTWNWTGHSGPNTNTPLRIGTSASWEPFIGLIDELSYYNRVLTTNEVAAIYAAGSSGKAPPPTLAVSLAGGGVLLSWPASAGGFGLVSRTNLATGTWEVVPNPPSLNGTRKEVLLPANTPAQRFFRLAQ